MVNRSEKMNTSVRVQIAQNVPPSGVWSAPGSPPGAEVVCKGGKKRLLFIFVLWHSHFSWDKRLSQSRKVHFVLLACTLFIFFQIFAIVSEREAIYFPLFCWIIWGQSYRDFVFCHMAAMAWDLNQSMSWLFFISLTFPILQARLYAWINVVYEESCETFASNNLPSKGMTITKAYLVVFSQQTCKHHIFVKPRF